MATPFAPQLHPPRFLRPYQVEALYGLGVSLSTRGGTVERLDQARRCLEWWSSTTTACLIQTDPRVARERRDLGRHGSGRGCRQDFYRTVTRSIPLSTNSFSLWSVPYLMAQGIALAELVEFGNIAREMLVGSFDDQPAEFGGQERRLVELLGGSELAARLRREAAALGN